MAKQINSYRPRGFNAAGVQFVNATGTTITTILAAGADDTIIKSLNITSDEAATTRYVQLYIYDGTTNYLLDTIPVPALAGSDGTVISVDALRFAGLPLDAEGKKILPLKQGHTLKAAMLVAVTAAKTVTVIAIAEDF